VRIDGGCQAEPAVQLDVVSELDQIAANVMQKAADKRGREVLNSCMQVAAVIKWHFSRRLQQLAKHLGSCRNSFRSVADIIAVRCPLDIDVVGGLIRTIIAGRAPQNQNPRVIVLTRK